MTTTRNTAALDLDRAQQHLSRLLLADDTDMQEVIEAADAVRRAECRCREAERCR